MLREFYKELNKDKQNSAETSSNLSNTSKNVDEARYVKCARNRFRIFDYEFSIDRMPLRV